MLFLDRRKHLQPICNVLVGLQIRIALLHKCFIIFGWAEVVSSLSSMCAATGLDSILCCRAKLHMLVLRRITKLLPTVTSCGCYARLHDNYTLDS